MLESRVYADHVAARKIADVGPRGAIDDVVMSLWIAIRAIEYRLDNLIEELPSGCAEAP
jgi:hypothetical protein